MTQEEIRERLSALCLYAPYGLKVKHDLQEFPCELQSIDKYRGSVECVPVGEKAYLGTQHFHVEFVKPILRTISSMTESEKKEWNSISKYGDDVARLFRMSDNSIQLWVDRDSDVDLEIDFDFVSEAIVWMCERKFDFMGLIPRELAVDEKTIKGGQYE